MPCCGKSAVSKREAPRSGPGIKRVLRFRVRSSTDVARIRAAYPDAAVSQHALGPGTILVMIHL